MSEAIEIHQWTHKFTTIEDSFPYGYWYIARSTGSNFDEVLGKEIESFLYLYPNGEWYRSCMYTDKDHGYYATREAAERVLARKVFIP